MKKYMLGNYCGGKLDKDGVVPEFTPLDLEAPTKMKVGVRKKGGSGSGHFQHAGRPGKHGGSLPGKAGNQARAGMINRIRNLQLLDENDPNFISRVDSIVDDYGLSNNDLERLYKSDVPFVLEAIARFPKSDLPVVWESYKQSDMKVRLEEMALEDGEYIDAYYNAAGIGRLNGDSYEINIHTLSDNEWISSLDLPDVMHNKAGTMVAVAAHEYAHSFDLYYKFSGTQKWSDAISVDKQSVSGYGRRNNQEDFAESMALMAIRPAFFKKRYPARYDSIRSMLDWDPAVPNTVNKEYVGQAFDEIPYRIFVETTSGHHLQLLSSKIIEKGGSGSGFFGHFGRPGKVGGSVPKGSSNMSNEELQHALADTSKWTRVDISGSTRGVSNTIKVHIEGDGDAIVKEPLFRSSDHSTVGYSTAKDPYKEEDTYRLAKELGWDVVPIGAVALDDRGFITDIAGIETSKDKPVSVQQWVDGARAVYKYGFPPESVHATSVDIEAFRQVAWIDTIIGNYDRHGANLLIKEVDGVATPVAIDNGLSFDVVRENSDAHGGIWFYDSVMSSDNHYGDVLGAVHMDPYKKEGLFPEGKRISRREYDKVVSFMRDTNNYTIQDLRMRYGDIWYTRALERVDHVREAADRRLFGYSWTD